MKRTKKVKAATNRVPSIPSLADPHQDLISGVVQLLSEKHKKGLCLKKNTTPSHHASQKVSKETLEFFLQWNSPAMETSSP